MITFSYNLLTAVIACGTVQTLPSGVYPLNQTQRTEVRNKIPGESPKQMEIIYFTLDVDVTLSWADYFLLEDYFAQGFN